MIFDTDSNRKSPSDSARDRYLKFYYFVVCSVIPFYLIKNNIIYSTNSWNWLLIPLTGLLLATPVLKNWLIDFNRRAYWIVLISTSILMILLYEAGGLHAPGLIWISALPMTFGVVLGRQGGVFGSLLMVCALLCYRILENYGQVGSIQFSQEEYVFERNINIITFGLYCILSVNYFLRNEEMANKEVSRQKAEVESLLRVLIHDVATPLTVSNMGLEGLEKSRNDEVKFSGLLKKIRSSHDTVVKMLSDIRTIRSYRDGKKEIRMQSMLMDTILADTIGLTEALAEKKKISFKLIIEDSALRIRADESVVKVIVFCNLFTNAIKFSEMGSQIEVRVRRDQKDCEVRVRDFGIGMPESLLQNLWNPSVQTSREGTRGEEGTGYGMPLVKEFVGRLGGSIAVRTSEINLPDFPKGTEFILRFPID